MNMESLKNLKILIVDDMFVMRKMMHKTISSLGITNILDAKDGRVAADLLRLEAAKSSPFDIVMSDWNMPEMTGLELLTYCRSNDFFKNIGFIMVTAESDASQLTHATKEGVDHYLTKPVVETGFADVLLSVCHKRSIKK